MPPNFEIERFGNRWRSTAMDALAVCAVAPSYFLEPQIFDIHTSSLQFRYEKGIHHMNVTFRCYCSGDPIFSKKNMSQ
ncbi:unnamed protein product [Callosobruchus maculatus]|uniref:Uncharacterized protein n=1 Tax=Callosobruchus maculatus TaxID=64391 RepID=A0A653BRJ8_CALMS|nr:unnamed protein product [Callosobruchus maculatus]